MTQLLNNLGFVGDLIVGIIGVVIGEIIFGLLVIVTIVFLALL
ncbi:MAG: hypothetical protein RL557_359 [archaeon]|jgi:uncharacterized membrane protein YeaQ/YmgE (transglycosylase-associated protein family)